jgi:hypothetical protein
VTGFSAPGRVAEEKTIAEKTANFRNKKFSLALDIGRWTLTIRQR